MSAFDRVILYDGINLPNFPDDGDPTELDWQTKCFSRTMSVYKISEDGRLLVKHREQREMTDDEKDEYARERGYDSWHDFHSSEQALAEIQKYTVDSEWWEDCEYHGSFEFHASTKKVDGYDDFYWSYEARFTNGDLDEIIFLGERMTENWKTANAT